MNKIFLKLLSVFILLLSQSCERLIEVDSPITSLSQKTVFTNSDIATSSILGAYASLANISGNRTISAVCGLSSDEFVCHNEPLMEISENQIDPVSTTNNAVYYNYFRIVFLANVILEGLNGAELPSPLQKQLRGEALFLRAFSYFYLVNLYGDVPLHLISDVRITRIAPKKSVDELYTQILKDLKEAEMLVPDHYVSTGRVRANLSVVQALLARVYLYLKDWGNAEKYASYVISRTQTYSLDDLDKVFLGTSKESILQLFPPINTTSPEVGFLIPSSLTTPPTNISLPNNFVLNEFESGDKRKVSWIKSYTISTGTFYYPFKLKIRTATVATEYSTVIRLAELFLIRAEARAYLNNISGGMEDVDQLRARAGILLLKNTRPDIGQADILIAIQKERKIELFSEWGHRWLDLKRTNSANTVLQPIKPNWQPTDELYPIPFDEVNRNPNVAQNTGY